NIMFSSVIFLKNNFWSHYVAQADLKLLGSSNPPATAFQSAGTVSHQAGKIIFFKENAIAK
uniref:Uncharacterized protein n=1 Tax=Meleagris gallopavo TaxID=9103 RepID=A0A803XUH0_MELGA